MMTEEEFIDSIASQLAVSEFPHYPKAATHPIIESRTRKVTSKIVNRVRIHTLTHMRRNLEAFAISQGYEPGEDSISYEMVFDYLNLETGKAMVALADESQK